MLILSLLLNVLTFFGVAALIWRMGGTGYVGYWLNQRGIAPLYEHTKSQFAMLPDAKNTVVMLGDSQTAYGEWAEWLNETNVRNRGIAGDGVAGVLARLDDIERLHPTKIYLMIGVNDLSFHRPDWVIAHYRTLVAAIRQRMSAAELIVQTILPVNNHVRNTGVENADIQQVNAEICHIAAENGVRCIDLFAHFVAPDGNLPAEFTSDGLHLNGKGYAKWANILVFSR